ncbi:MAG: prepilin peptidase [Pseudomonadota bacterium]
MTLVLPEAAFFALTLPFSLWVAWSDLKFMRISNRLNIVLFCVFLVAGMIFLPLDDYGLRIAIAVAALVIGFIANMLGVMGGGDAKYIAAFIPFIAPEALYEFLFIMSMCLLTAVLVHRLARATPAVRRYTPDWVSWQPGMRFPMGLGLSGGLSFYLAIVGFNLPFAPG